MGLLPSQSRRLIFMKRHLLTLSLALAALTVHAEILVYQVTGTDGKPREYQVAVQPGSLLQFSGTGLKPLPVGSAFTASGSLALAGTQAGNFSWTGTHGFASINVGGVLPLLANDKRIVGRRNVLTAASTFTDIINAGEYEYSGEDELYLQVNSAKSFSILNLGPNYIYLEDLSGNYYEEVRPFSWRAFVTYADSGPDEWVIEGTSSWAARYIADNYFSGPASFANTVAVGGRVTLNGQPAITSASSNDGMTLSLARALAERDAMEWVTVQAPPWYNYGRGTIGVNSGTVVFPTADNAGNGVGGGVTLNVAATAGSLAVFRNPFYPFINPGAGANDNTVYWNAPLRMSWLINNSHIRTGITSRYYFGVGSSWDGGEISVKGFGFEVISGTARGVSHNGTSKSATSSTLTISARRLYKLSAFSDGSTVSFYINGTSLGSLSAPGGNSAWPNMSAGISLASDGTNSLNAGGEGLFLILQTASWKSQH